MKRGVARYRDDAASVLVMWLSFNLGSVEADFASGLYSIEKYCLVLKFLTIQVLTV